MGDTILYGALTREDIHATTDATFRFSNFVPHATVSLNTSVGVHMVPGSVLNLYSRAESGWGSMAPSPLASQVNGSVAVNLPYFPSR